MSDTSVSSIISGVKEGDHAAVEKLWTRYFDKLVGVARRQLSSVPKRTFDEEDVAVSVFDSLCRGAERGNFTKLSDREDLWAILLALTRQKTVDRIRHETRKKRGGGDVRGESVFAKAGAGSVAFGIDQLLAEDPTHEYLVELQEQHERLLGTLSDDTLRKVVALRFDGLTAKEIGREFGFGSRWAERKLQMIRKKWLRELEEHDG